MHKTMTASDKNLILVLDLGSTSARAFVINTHNFDIIGSAKYEVSDAKFISFKKVEFCRILNAECCRILGIFVYFC